MIHQSNGEWKNTKDIQSDGITVLSLERYYQVWHQL